MKDFLSLDPGFVGLVPRENEVQVFMHVILFDPMQEETGP